MKNRPSKQEIKACGPWLDKQIEVVKPKLITTLGMVPTQYLLKVKSNTKLKDLIGKTYSIGSGSERYNVIPNLHPSYVMGRSKKDVIVFTKIFEEIKNAICNQE